MARSTRASRRAHFAIVGINYAPEQTGIGPYTTAMSERLAEVGHDVTVVTGMPHYPQWRVAPPYRGQLSTTEERNGVCLLRFASYVPRRQSALKRGLYEGSFLVNAGRALRRLQPPTAIVGVVPALAGAVLARLLARRFGAPYGLIFQDLMSLAATQSGIAGGRRVAAATARVESWAAGDAAAVATVSERFTPHLVELGVSPDRIVHLPNWHHTPDVTTADRSATRARLGWRSDEVVVLHAGNMGLKQNLEQVVAAARLAAATQDLIRFAFLGDGSQREPLQAAAANLPNVSFHGFEPDATFPDALAAADVLLVSERSSTLDMSLPSKLTSYFAAGRPVVAAVAPAGGTAGEIERSGGGIVVPPDLPQELVDAIRLLSRDESRSRELAQSARAYAGDSLAAEPALERAVRFFGRVAAASNPTQ